MESGKSLKGEGNDRDELGSEHEDNILRMHYLKSKKPKLQNLDLAPFEWMFPQVKVDFEIFELEMFLKPIFKAKKASSS